MDSSFGVDKLLYLVVSLLVDVAFGSLGLIALVATSVRVEESRLPRLLAKARMGFAAPASGPLPVAAYWWGARLIGAGFVVASQVAELRGLTGSGPSYPVGILLPFAIAEWVILIAWSGWVIWAFLRATGPGGTLPVKLDPPVQPSRYRLNDQPTWTEPTDGRPPQDGNGQD